MPIIRFLPHEEICPEGKEVDAPSGETILNVALKNDIALEHACEKSCACTTCHVYVHEDWVDKVGEVSPTEEAMLSLSTDRQENSRLSCQIDLTEELDGLSVTVPAEAHDMRRM